MTRQTQRRTPARRLSLWVTASVAWLLLGLLISLSVGRTHTRNPPRADWFELLQLDLFTLFQVVLGAIGLVALVLAILSFWWTSYHQRRILRRSLGRKVRAEDETSLETWMNLRGDQLADAERELARNPFDRPLDALETLGEQLAEGAKISRRKDQ